MSYANSDAHIGPWEQILSFQSRLCRKDVSHRKANIQRELDIFITSYQRASTLMRRCFNVACPLGMKSQ